MFLLAKDTVKFAVLVGLSAISIDAVIAHGLFWDMQESVTKSASLACSGLKRGPRFLIGRVQRFFTSRS